MDEIQQLNYKLVPLSCPKGRLAAYSPKSFDGFYCKAAVSHGDRQRAPGRKVFEREIWLNPRIPKFEQQGPRLVRLATKS